MTLGQNIFRQLETVNCPRLGCAASLTKPLGIHECRVTSVYFSTSEASKECISKVHSFELPNTLRCEGMPLFPVHPLHRRMHLLPHLTHGPFLSHLFYSTEGRGLACRSVNSRSQNPILHPRQPDCCKSLCLVHIILFAGHSLTSRVEPSLQGHI